jgi:8-oxo-dGTP diphosphatase
MAYEKHNKLHIVAVTAVIRNNQGKYLVLKRHDKEIAHSGMYMFPGGKVEDNETIEEALVKEIEEEAGLKLKPGKILLKDASFVRPDGQSVKVFAYLCEAEISSQVKISQDFTDFKWLSLEELKQLPHLEDIQNEIIQAEKIINSRIDLNLIKTKSSKFS